MKKIAFAWITAALVINFVIASNAKKDHFSYTVRDAVIATAFAPVLFPFLAYAGIQDLLKIQLIKN